MNGRLFTLVDALDQTEIFAWGMEITDEDRTEAVVYRPDPATRQGMFGLHTSAAAARRRYSRIRPMAVVWEDQFDEEDVDDLSEPSRLDAQDVAADPEPRRP